MALYTIDRLSAKVVLCVTNTVLDATSGPEKKEQMDTDWRCLDPTDTSTASSDSPSRNPADGILVGSVWLSSASRKLLLCIYVYTYTYEYMCSYCSYTYSHMHSGNRVRNQYSIKVHLCLASSTLPTLKQGAALTLSECYNMPGSGYLEAASQQKLDAVAQQGCLPGHE